jgi:hypothetical protein
LHERVTKIKNTSFEILNFVLLLKLKVHARYATLSAVRWLFVNGLSFAEETRRVLLFEAEPGLLALEGHSDLGLSLRTQTNHSSS